MSCITGYILAKNEESNINRCIESIKPLGIQVIVLDSGSVDNTVEIAAGYPFVTIEKYKYTDHLTAYNYICKDRTSASEYALVLDADMALTPELCNEIKLLVNQSGLNVIAAPIQMYWNGHKLTYGSLCPAKSFLFKGGPSYFAATGHGETVLSQYDILKTRYSIIHDDRKDFSTYLQTQMRYAANLLKRTPQGDLTWRDRIRIRTPMMVFVSPFFSLFCRLGIFSGKIGMLYAMDRLIAEAINYREILANRIADKRAWP